ncbi:ribonuclease HIII [Mycoplasma sp. P36-A1]|uniref:ribonuclease HIII n=1 Tax=Mycoplasma sp. P36-A1 TaxID=3252900 RepID=UPI003C2E409B
MNKVIQADDMLLEQIRQYYASDIDENNNVPHSKFVISTQDIKVIAYNSNKVMFQGKDAAIQADMWINQQNHDTKKQNLFDKPLPQTASEEYIGSDEVGTGDYFGPVVVCSAYINREITRTIAHLNLGDSKNYTDEKIIALAKEIKNIVPHYIYILDNTKYNETQPTNNLNMIKAKMHNYSIRQCMKLVGKKVDVVLDQFCQPKTYYSYLVNSKNVTCDIIFETKAESKYLGVAVASILARNAFLEQMDILSKDYNITIPKGASSKVDLVGAQLVKDYGFEILSKVAKVHFANTKKIKEIIKQQEM